MKNIGITGGVGTGKSTILEYLKNRYKATICMADDVAKSVEKKGHDCYNRLVEAFGSDILDENGNIDKEGFARVIFSDNRCLKAANEIIHPAVKKYILDLMKEEKNKGTEYFILEAALLIEDGYKAILDETWYVSCSEGVRRKRLKESRGYSDEKINSIINNQMDEDEYRVNCDHVVVNNGAIEETYKQIDKLLGVR